MPGVQRQSMAAEPAENGCGAAMSDLHKPMEDCGHCWAERTGHPDRDGDWGVIICEECDELWPCAAQAEG